MVRIVLLVLGLLLSVTNGQGQWIDIGRQAKIEKTLTVATLETPAASDRRLRVVTDGTAADPCGTGGGSVTAICRGRG